ncbi:branched-chain amino acid ABC transporter substrate-binding protein [Leucobacter sp. W1038]|uniref:branched-chain amino acid ABC transporter substrate-binding protein n=1 Tax=Leucobacter sp. W1038 TaxID=3438281 RepID=UPI003D99ED62
MTLNLAGCAGAEPRAGASSAAAESVTDVSGASGSLETPESLEGAVVGGEAQNAEDAAETEAPIKLGMLVPLTGSESAFGESMRNGARLAVDELNRDGGVNGRELELVVIDDACDAVTAYEAAPRLVAAGIDASVGGYCAGAVLPTLPIFGEAGIPSVVPAGASLALVGQGAFLMSGGPVQEAAAWLNVVRQYRPAAGASGTGATGGPGARTGTGSARGTAAAISAPVAVALLDDRTASARELAELFQGQIEWAERGSHPAIPTIVHSGSVTSQGGDRDEAILATLESNPDLIVWTGNPLGGVPLVDGLRAAGFRGPILVSGTADRVAPLSASEGPGVISPRTDAEQVAASSLDSYAAAGLAELVYATSPLTPELLTSEVLTPELPTGEAEWIAAYTSAFGIVPGQYSLEAYDAVRVVAEAMTVAGSTRGDLVTTALQSRERFAVFSGTADFDHEGMLRGTGTVRMVASLGDGAGVVPVTDLRRWTDSRVTG